LSFFGGFQHAVPPVAPTNSFLNLLIFENLASYSPEKLKGNDRREIKRAATTFTVSLVTDVHSFKSQAYPAYRSFYERTQYGYKAERRYENNFSKWADTLFQHPKVIVLGAYKTNGELGAISIWYLVDDTLTYATFFCDTESLRMHAAGFLLHTMREAATRCPNVRQIFVGNYKFSSAKGVDGFYLARGCRLVRKPAWLQLNPLAALALKRFAPQQYGRLIGEIQGVSGTRVIEPGPSTSKPDTGNFLGGIKAGESATANPPQ
jgi:hypothetical protein